MKATGIVRKIDDLGRIVIPMEIRRVHDIKEGDPMEIYTDVNGEVVLVKYVPVQSCAICGNTERLHSVQNKFVCEKCIKEVQVNGCAV